MFNSNASYLSLPGSILLVGVLSGILDLAIAFYEFRKTTFARQLHLLKASIYQLILVLIAINLITSLIGSLWLFLIAFLVMVKEFILNELIDLHYVELLY
ncbi:MAG: hypothetical protein EHV01_006750 [Spiroplasma sp. hy2]